jgi:CubicO group peptidase (beta-lactamase class C family)
VRRSILILIALAVVALVVWQRDPARRTPLERVMATHGFTAASLAYGDVGRKPHLKTVNADAERSFAYWSLSKPITSALALTTLDLEDEVEGASVRQLLMHTGGWDREIAGDPVTDSAGGRDCTRLSAGPKQFAPGARYAYSNLGYCLLGRAIEDRTSESYRVAANRLLPETRRMDYDPVLGPAGGWSGTAAQYFRFASRPLPDLSERIERERGLPYSLGWASDGEVATHFGALHDGFAQVVRTGDFVAVALFDGRPVDDHAAEEDVRRVLLDLRR